jgi:hypothetical protein
MMQQQQAQLQARQQTAAHPQHSTITSNSKLSAKNNQQHV